MVLGVVTALAQPANIERLRVVVVMRFRFLTAAPLAGLSNELSTKQSPANGRMCEVFLSIPLTILASTLRAAVPISTRVAHDETHGETRCGDRDLTAALPTGDNATYPWIGLGPENACPAQSSEMFWTPAWPVVLPNNVVLASHRLPRAWEP